MKTSSFAFLCHNKDIFNINSPAFTKYSSLSGRDPCDFAFLITVRFNSTCVQV